MLELALTPLLLLVAVVAAVPGLLIAAAMLVVWLLHIWYERDDTATGARFVAHSRSGYAATALRNYFRIRLDRVFAEERHQRSHIYLLNPHGILAAASLGILSWEEGPLLAIHSWFFLVPLIRALMLRHGAIDSRESTLRAHLQAGHSIAIYPDGTRAMGKEFLPHSRFFVYGIVRIAFELRVPIVPVYCHGEKELCWYWAGEWRWVTFIRRCVYSLVGYPIPTVFLPRWLFTGSRPAPLILKFGESLHPMHYNSAENFQLAYIEALDKLMVVQ